MSFSIAAAYSDVESDDPVVEINEQGSLLVWPVGRPGPLMVTSPEHWLAMDAAVQAALASNRSYLARVLPLHGYAAQEGHNGDED